jgi:hypothetical protein
MSLLQGIFGNKLKPVKVDGNGQIFVNEQIENEIIHTTTANWANSAVAGTAVTIDVPLTKVGSKTLVVVTNPSTETALTVTARNKNTLSGVAKYPKLTTVAIPVNSPDGVAAVLEGFIVGEGGRLVLTNDAAVGLTGAFTADVQIITL